MMQRRLRRYGIHICLILFGLFLGLLLSEAGVRLLFPHTRDHVIPGGLFDLDSELGWVLRPDIQRRHRSRYFDVSYAINALGFRDGARDMSKPDQQYRILFYGDSQIFGWGIARGQRFSNRLEQQHPPLEAWNLGVPGYGLDQQVLAYEQAGHHFQADEIILLISRGTLKRLKHTYIYRKHKPAFRLDFNERLLQIPLPQRAVQWERILYKTLSPFYLPYFVDRQLARIQAGPSADRAQRNPLQDAESITIGGLEKAILERAAQVARQRNDRLTLLAFLPPETIQPLKDTGIWPHVDIIPIAFDGDYEELVLGPDDRHWNPHAHELIARQLSPFIAARLSADAK
jgi:hypothetical protein